MADENICTRLQACLLIYDIPDSSDFPNPSGRLRPLAVRVNLSCWIIPERDIPYGLLSAMSAAGCTWHVVRFAVGEGEKLVTMAIDSIRRDIREALARARQTRSRAEGRLTGEESPEDAVRRYRQFNREQRQIVRRLNTLLASFRQVSERFGIDPKSIDLNGSLTAVRTIKTGMQLRVDTYRKMMEFLDIHFGRDNGMSAAMRADAVPAGIVADYAQDKAETTEQYEDAEFFRTLFMEDES